MLLLGSVILAALLPCSWGAKTFGIHTKPPVAKCKNPMPSRTGFDYSSIVGTEYDYIYTPKVKLFSLVNSIKLTLTKTATPKVYKGTMVIKFKIGTSQTNEMETEDIGSGILKMKSMAGEEFLMSVVATVGQLNLLYLCSDTVGKDNERDGLYVISKTSAAVQKTKPPMDIFKEALTKNNFNANFKKLSRKNKSSKKGKKDKKEELEEKSSSTSDEDVGE